MLGKALFHARVRLENAAVRQANRLPRSLLYRLTGGRPECRGDRTLSAEMQVIAFAERQMRPLHDYPLAEMRERYHYVSCMMSPQVSAPVIITSRRLKLDSARGGSRSLTMRIYTPPRGPFPKPVMVYYHGGGWCMGSSLTHESLCKHLAEVANITIVSVDYRLAPEHPYPLPAEDAIDSWQWIAANVDSLAGRPDRLLVGGDSAGANLATIVCQQAIVRGYRAPHGQVLIYPATDLRRCHASHEEMGQGYVLTTDLIDWFVGRYLGDMNHANHALVSPLLASPAVMRQLPPAAITTCGFDPLRDEGEEYARALANQGVAVDYHEFPDLLHGFVGMMGVSDDALAGGNKIGRQILDLLARMDLFKIFFLIFFCTLFLNV